MRIARIGSAQHRTPWKPLTRTKYGAPCVPEYARVKRDLRLSLLLIRPDRLHSTHQGLARQVGDAVLGSFLS